MLCLHSLEVTFEIYEANFSVNIIDDTVHNEVYIVTKAVDDIDKMMKKCESISTFLVTTNNHNDLIFSGYKLNEFYVNPENEKELIIIFNKDFKK